MKKILEALFTYHGTDGIVATTMDIDSNERTLLNSTPTMYAEMRYIDRDNGLLLEGDEVTPNYNLRSLYYQLDEYGRAVAGTCQGYQPEGNFRGNPEYVHFISIDKSLDYRSVDLFALDALSLEARQLETHAKDDIDFSEIKEQEIKQLKVNYSRSDIINQKDNLVKLIDYIFYAKNKGKTLYVCYAIEEYESFKDLLFLALRFLPRELANKLSFITMFGGGVTNSFNIVGVPTDNGDVVNKSGFNHNGVVVYFPFEDTIKKEVLDNPFHTLMEKINTTSELSRLEQFIAKDDKQYRSIDEYLLPFELYSPLFSKITRFDGNERAFIEGLDEHLSYLKEHLSFIEKELNEDELSDLLDGLIKAFDDVKDVSNFGESGVDLYRHVINNLHYLITHASKKEVIDFAYQAFILFIFNFNVDADNEAMLSFHNALIEMVYSDKELNKFMNGEFIEHTSSREERNIIDLLKENAEVSSEYNKISSLYFVSLLTYTLAHYEYSKSMVVNLLLLIRSSRTIKERIDIVFSSKGLAIEDKVDILIDLLLKNEDDEGSQIAEIAIEYFKENKLLYEVIPLVKKTHVHSRNSDDLVANFRNELLDAYIGVESIKTYSELKTALNALTKYDERSAEFEDIKARIFSYHISEFDFSTIEKLTIKQVEDSEGRYFALIIKLLEKEGTEIAKKFIETIENKQNEKDTLYKAKRLEDELTTFRVDFLARIMSTLPIKKSRKLIYNNPQVLKFANQNGYTERLRLKGQEYAVVIEDLTKEFFLQKIDNPNVNALLEIKRNFASSIVAAQNDSKFNIKDAASAITTLVSSIIVGFGAFALSVFIGGIARQYITNGSYVTMYLILAALLGAGSFLITMVNSKNAGRKPILLISILESLLFIVLGLGLFILIFVLGGK